MVGWVLKVHIFLERKSVIFLSDGIMVLGDPVLATSTKAEFISLNGRTCSAVIASVPGTKATITLPYTAQGVLNRGRVTFNGGTSSVDNRGSMFIGHYDLTNNTWETGDYGYKPVGMTLHQINDMDYLFVGKQCT